MADPVPQLDIANPWPMPPQGPYAGQDYSQFARNTGFGYNNYWDQLNDAFQLPGRGAGIYSQMQGRYGTPAPTGLSFPATNGNYTGMFSGFNPQGQRSNPHQIGYNGGNSGYGNSGYGGGNGGLLGNNGGRGGVASGAGNYNGGRAGPVGASGGGLLGRPVTNGGQGTAQYDGGQNSGIPQGNWGAATDPTAFYRQLATSNQGGALNGGQNAGNIQPAYSAGTINNMSAGGNEYNPIAQVIGQYQAQAARTPTVNQNGLDFQSGVQSGQYVQGADGQYHYNTDPAYLKQMAQQTMGTLSQGAQDKFGGWLQNYQGT